MVSPASSTWRGQRVFLTGHTGFKGSWLSLWLAKLGAVTHGYALNPPTDPSLFDVARVSSLLASDTRADLADLDRLTDALRLAAPKVVFHLAAQPLVREGYRSPIETFVTNVIGTAHLLQAVRETPSVEAVVIITTDKVYENLERSHAYREVDALGGRDPYGASKAAAELVVSSYRASFFATQEDRHARIASARAGNVIGGGDWAPERLVPDCFRADVTGSNVKLRYPQAVRPWQHVLEPLRGYLLLAEKLLSENGDGFATAWNFGPDVIDEASVGHVAQLTASLLGKPDLIEDAPSLSDPHEAGVLRIDSTRANTELDWRPRWGLQTAIEQSVAWHKAWKAKQDLAAICLQQIDSYDRAGAR